MGIRVGRWRITLAAAALAAAWAVGVSAAGFVGVLEDLPLMPGLTEDTQSHTVFETASGRIVQAVATGSAAPKGVMQFYDTTLPQLGWCRLAPGVFLREGEKLRLEVGDRQGAFVTVRFTLAPSTTDKCP